MPVTEAIQRTSLRDRVRDRLAKLIIDGGLAPCEPIRLQETAAALEVSMTPLREALIALEGDGLVRSESGRGFVVAPLEVREVEDLYPLIALLETRALRDSPPGESGLRELTELNERMRKARTARRRIDLDRRWHETLLKRCPNAILLETLDRMRRRARRYELAYMTREGAPRVSIEQHDRIVSALDAGEIDEAIAALEANWRIGPEVLVPWLAERGAA
ncbi:MAG: GntR family transcriptional regulator [Gemmatimonadota bacterium]